MFYRELISAIAAEPGLSYHTADDVPGDHHVTVKDATFQVPTSRRKISARECDG